MLFSAINSNKLSNILAAIILLAFSSGLTVVHHTCMMKDRGCCDAMRFGGSMNHAASSGGSSFRQQEADCCKTALSGGLNYVTALAEKHAKADNQKFSFAPFHPDPAATVVQPAPVGGLFTQHPRSASPPSVVKYVLFGSLLI